MQWAATITQRWYARAERAERRAEQPMQILIRVVIALLLVIHGCAHWNIITAWGSQPLAFSWLLSRRGVSTASLQVLGNGLWLVALFGFLVAGLALFFGAPWWRILAIPSSIISLVTMVLFWQPNMVFGALVDVGILFALLWADSPVAVWVGVK
jgi:uncharacterized membrane protein YphA (DoxX/SURF4 family)